MPTRGALARVTLLTATDAVSSWNESWRDADVLWSLLGPALFASCASLAGGLLVVLLLNAPLLMRGSEQRLSGPLVAASDSQLAVPTRVRVSAGAAVVSTPIAANARVAPVAPVATVVAAPTADAEWAAMLPSLDAAWGTDTPQTLDILNAFHARFPDFQPAQEKLYAALMATAQGLARGGASDAAEAQLSLAAALLPDRGEAPTQRLSIAASRAQAANAMQVDDAPP